MPDATTRTRTIGVVPPTASQNLASIPYFQGCLNGIVNEAENSGNDLLLLLSYDQTTDQDQVLKLILSKPLDGLILLSPPTDGKLLSHLRERSIPYVGISTRLQDAVCVGVENATGVDQAIDHLLSLGHRKIAHISGPMNIPDAIERLDAYRAALHRHGLPIPDRYVVRGGFVDREGYEAMQKLIWLTDPPTAVFCGNDDMAVGAIRAIWESGRRVPRDFSIVGFDDSYFCESTIPSITSVRQPWPEMGSTACRLLLHMLEGRSVESQVFPVQLVVRSSTSHPGEDFLKPSSDA